jgi:hypothetical protein
MNGGNVGIGTTNPRSKFTVENGNIYMNYDTYSNCFIGGGPSGAQGQSYVGFTFPGEYDTHQLEFGCHGTLTAFFKRNYNDGINQFNILSNVFVNPQYFNGPALAVRPQTGGTPGPIVQFSNIAGGANTFIMTDTGRIGIGTATPNAPLNVWGSGPYSGLSTNPQPGQFIINTTTGTERLILGTWYTGGTGSICSIQSSDYYSSVDHGQSLILNPLGGNVGIGSTVPPQTTLWLPSTSATSGIGIYNADVAMILGNTAGSSQSNTGSIQVKAGGSSTAIGATNYNLTLNPLGGSVGVNVPTGTAFSYTFQVIGNIGASGDITALYSDERLKTKTGTLENALDKVCSLDTFTYRNNELAQSFGFKDDYQRVGVSAQQVQKVLPEAVRPAPFDAENQSGQNYLTVQYEKLVPLLIESLKEERRLRCQLEERVAALESASDRAGKATTNLV